MLRHSGAPPHIGCCRCAHRIVPISGKPEIGCGEPGIHNPGRWLWIPGSPPSVAPRNDQAARMIGFIESLY